MRRPKLTPEDDRYIWELYDYGRSVGEIAERLQRPVATIRRAMKRYDRRVVSYVCHCERCQRIADSGARVQS